MTSKSEQMTVKVHKAKSLTINERTSTNFAIGEQTFAREVAEVAINAGIATEIKTKTKEK